MDKTKRKKIIYVPGIISLTILPLLFIYLSQKEIKSRTLTVLPIYFVDKNVFEKNREWFSDYWMPFQPLRNYQDIIITGEIKNDNIKLKLAQLKIRGILLRQDTTNGLHFTFSKSSTYGTFVSVTNIIKIENAKTYTAIDNELWVYNRPPDKTVNTLSLNCLLCDDVLTIEPKVSLLTKAKDWTKRNWRSSKEIILVFIAFLFSIFNLRQNITAGNIRFLCKAFLGTCRSLK